ncbi:MAG TPA: malto-oligosyltrehalose trehalohydrolase [Gemmatimonadales bacterium]
MPARASASLPSWRRLPVGAELDLEGGVHFRVWAPERGRVRVRLEGTVERPEPEGGIAVELRAEAGGYHSGRVAEAAAGTLYRFLIDDDAKPYPDPASRRQPDGPHGPSAVVDADAFRWTDGAWTGMSLPGQVIYEMHVGAFTPEGTFAAAARELEELRDAGITLIEMMPVADFPGRFGWGYDGVNLFAPTHLYGTPDDLRSFVDRAHELGVGVILDVVYNHLGPDGNYLRPFSPHYFSEVATEWGDALNFDGEGCGPVREYFVANARYWIDEFHFDGLRLDATQSIHDSSRPHILAEISAAVREAAKGRRTIVVGENEPQEAKLMRPASEGGCGLDGLWNDDFHHSAMVALTGQREAYYLPHLGRAQEFVSAAKHGFLYQGQRYHWQDKRRGTPALDMEPWRFVHFTQNHDQVANSVRGLRVHALTSPGRHRAMTALLLLGPQTPMLFMGQEFAASTPFLYFADHDAELARLVEEGRREFMSQFPSADTPETRGLLPPPHDRAAFERSKLDLSERDRHREAYDLHRDLLRIRREDPVLSAQRHGALDGAVLDEHSFVLRWFGDGGDDRLLLVNLGPTLEPDITPEPLLAPPAGRRWRTLWSSEDPRYGGIGTPHPDSDERGLRLPAESAVLLSPSPSPTERRGGEDRRLGLERRVTYRTGVEG